MMLPPFSRPYWRLSSVNNILLTVVLNFKYSRRTVISDMSNKDKYERYIRNMFVHCNILLVHFKVFIRSLLQIIRSILPLLLRNCSLGDHKRLIGSKQKFRFCYNKCVEQAGRRHVSLASSGKVLIFVQKGT